MTTMKNSNIEWIGDIPSSWDVRRNKYNFTLNKKLVGNLYNATQLLSLTKNGIKAITEDDQKGKVPTSFATYQTVDKDDIVMCLFDLDVSAVFSGISGYDGMISPAYKCFKCNNDMFPRYVDYYFRTVFVNRKYKRYSKNVRYSIGADEFMALPILIPPFSIQQSIANFLDKKCSEIESLSADIQSQIDVLEEYKKSVITETVTKGLNPDVEMKDSGITWIGIIPSHWDISRIKYCLTNNDGGVWGNDPTDSNSDKVVLRSTEQTIDGHWDITDPAIRNIGNHCKQYRIMCNDLLITKSSGSSLHIGKTTLADEYFNQHECYYSNFLQRLRVNKKMLPKFLWYLMNNTIVREQFVLMQNSTIGIGNINSNNINEVYIPIPNIEEQNIINQYLDLKCSEIDAIIADKKAQLETLAEYKKSLIYEYVTGKKEVSQ